MSLVVVKLGGSLLEGSRARRWLEALQDRPVVVVPGGGPFADAVRLQQAVFGYDDAAAHRMAVLAMAQTAWVMRSWCPAWGMADEPDALQAGVAAGRPMLWAPITPPDTPATWDITSDSLAAWLAARLGAVQLVIVKSRAALGTTPAAWAAEGLVDPAFPGYAAAFGGEVRLVAHDAEPWDV